MSVYVMRKLKNFLWCCLLMPLGALFILSHSAPPTGEISSQENLRHNTFPHHKQLENFVDLNKLNAGLRRIPEFEETQRSGLFKWIFGSYIQFDRLAYGTRVVAAELCKKSPEVLKSNHYVRRLPPPQSLSIWRRNLSVPDEGPLQDVRDYFIYLKTLQSTCHKAVTMGGQHLCRDVTDDLMDGSKVVCLDPPLELSPRRNPQSCLILSFGVYFDTTFDTAVSNFNCEIHMFDMLDRYKPTELLSKSNHSYFHQVGISDKRIQNYYLNIKKEIPVDTLVGILANYNLTNRPIHILKMDIEDDEWPVFEQLVKDPIMDAIGQIALEIHSSGLEELPPEDHLAYIQRRYNVLRAIETRGFQSVAYWENKSSPTYKDLAGTTFHTCGEIHFVNSKWYDDTFKKNLKDLGYKFKLMMQQRNQLLKPVPTE